MVCRTTDLDVALPHPDQWHGRAGYRPAAQSQFDFVDVKLNYLVRSMFTMYIFIAISVGYIILVVMQIVLFYINL